MVEIEMQDRIDHSHVRPARPEEILKLAAVLTAAFSKDPVHLWLFPDAEQRKRNHPRMFEGFLRYGMRHALIYTTNDLEGAAIWESPRSALSMLIGQTELGLRIAPAFGRRVFAIARDMHVLPQLHPKAPHWYLPMLGCDPTHQGKGVGGALLRVILDRCDRESLPAYLEASREENVPYYQRFGFEVVGPTRLGNGPFVWRMLRAPRKAAV